MKAYEDLTIRGKLRRTRCVARTALEAFGLTETRMRLIVDSGNTLYRVKAMDPTPMERSLYVESYYLLRLHWPGYHNDATGHGNLRGDSQQNAPSGLDLLDGETR